MADLIITATSVVAASAAAIKHVTAGATIVAGKAVVRDPASGKWVLADSNHATAALRVPGGIAANGASDGQPLAVHTAGQLTLGAVLAAGLTYYLSDTPGGICPAADVGSGERSVLVGIATSASVLDVAVHDSGVTV